MSKEKKQTQGFKARMEQKTAPYFEKIGNLSRLQRFLICVLTLGLIGAAYYYVFLEPRLKSITKLENEHAALSSKLITYKTKAASLKKYEEKFKAAEDAFHTALAALPDKKEIPSLLTAISNSGNNAGLEFLLFRPEKEVKNNFYAEIPVSIKVEGGYHQLTQFFDRVSQLSRLVNIKDIVVNYSKQDDSLAASCKSLTYMFVEKVDAEKQPSKSKKGRGRRK